jgi:hypothetical protein
LSFATQTYPKITVTTSAFSYTTSGDTIHKLLLDRKQSGKNDPHLNENNAIFVFTTR